MTTQLATSKLGIGQVFGNGLRLYAATFKATFPLFIMFFVWLCVAYYFTSGILLSNGDAETAPGLARLLLNIVVIILVNVIFFAAAYYKIYNFAIEKSITNFAAFMVGVKKLPIMILAAFVGVASVCILLIIPCGYLFIFVELFRIQNFFVFLGVIPLIIPVIYLGLIIALFYPTVVMENFANPLKVFKHFGEFVWGNWWRSMVVNVVPSIVLSGLIVLFDYVSNQMGMKQSLVYFYTLIQALCSALFLFVTAGIFITQIHDLKIRRQEKLAADAFLQMAKNNNKNM